MNHEEIKRYFEASPPPKEVQLTPWAKDSKRSLKPELFRLFSGGADTKKMDSLST